MRTMEPWAFTDFPPDHHQQPTAPTFAVDAPPPNVDKDLPPMPRPSTDSQAFYGEREDEVRGRPSTDWIDMDSGSETSDVDLEYLRSQPTSPSFAGDHIAGTEFSRGSIRATPTESATVEGEQADIYHTSTDSSLLSVPPSQSMASSPISAAQHLYASHSPLLRSVSEGEGSFLAESPPARSFARPPKQHQQLPDPAHFPDPYPFRPPHHHLTSGPPALSSGGSSSASTRSSAYTSSGSALASGDYGHVHVASGEDEVGVAVGITSDDVVQLMASDSAASSLSQSGTQSRAPIDQTRWSDYSASLRSRSSSIGHSNTNSMHEVTAPRLSQKPSYDMNWESVDERDEAGLMSEEETDDDRGLEEDLGDEDEDEQEEERTAAVVIAEEGRGHIVRGDGVPIVQLHVEPGTTHLLVGSSSTPNAVPAFLAHTLPQICNTLLALDISANFLVAVPPALASCSCLEELNIASNPLRVIPVFLSHLTSLRVLIADSTGISTLPDSFTELDKLHTLSVRRNKMNALPSWLCLLFSLQTLYVDGNPFQGPWKALTEPLLAKVPMTPVYPPSTPMFPLPSASIASSTVGTEDESDFSDPPTAEKDGKFTLSPEEEDTITPEKSPFLNRPVPHTAPFSNGRPGLPQVAPRLTRTRTTPNRAAYTNSRADKSPDPSGSGPSTQQSSYKAPGERGELRKMKSAGELRPIGTDTLVPPAAVPRYPPMGTPVRPSLTQYGSGSSSNLLSTPESDVPPVIAPKRFASLGATAGLSAASLASSSRTPSRNASGSRPALTQSLWDNISESEDDPTSSPETKNKRASSAQSPPDTPARHRPRERSQTSADQSPVDRHSMGRSKDGRDGKEKGRWGFLKKMSMGKMRIDSPTSSGRSTPMSKSISEGPTPLFKPDFHSPPQKVSSPRIDVRFSTTGTLGNISSSSVLPEQPGMSRKPSTDALKVSTLSPSSSNLLVPPTSTSPTSRAAKRRSFLPIDTPLPINIPTPSNFMPGVTASGEDDIPKTPAPAPDPAELTRREEENMREASARGLRAVMAYLKDMNDLNQSSAPAPATYPVSTSEEGIGLGPRSRRPTVVESGRGASDSAITQVQRTGSFGQLRPMESMAGVRNSNPMQTLSTATTDSSGSGEERKYKDDRAKRAMVVREIVETERTYVKGLEELVDLYIKPSAAPVNMLSGVGSSKDTVVPASERKIVFNGLDALFSFHKESFLPALEVAAGPVMASASALQEADADGQLSLKVVKDVAGMFIKHAAFMRMYSSYINNFDNSLQRVKYWSTKDGPSNQVTPASSTAQLVGLGLTMSAVSNPGMTDPGASSANGVANLSTSQKKRVRSYLKRCRMNPRHSQLNLEGYLLLPVQRIPRYRLLLEELLRSTPPSGDYVEDPLDKALAEISSLANNMNEGKRESESRRKLVQWQARIRGRFPSPLVQPHRRLIMDGPLLLTRVVRKAMVSFEAINALGDAATVQVDCLAPELTPRPLVGILCNDLLVLCRDPSEGKDTTGPVDLWAVLRMQTLPQPASIVHGNALRLVDNKAILYFDAPSPSDALNWFRAINLHIPASKS